MAIERLQKIIADRGFSSRRKAEEYITAGLVKVDGVTVTELGSKFEDNVRITIENRVLEIDKSAKKYIVFFKPRGVITTMKDPLGRKCVGDYFKKMDERVFPVGRLDYDVSGVLIMTNDGDFANHVAHPRYNFHKTYQALIKGEVKSFQIKQLKTGVIIEDDYLAKAIDAKIANYSKELNETIITMVLNEGHKHHVKNMIAAAGMELVKLQRTMVEDITIEGLKPGMYREFKAHEVKKFYGKIKSHKEIK
ncbi:23S rRNA pseudouridine 2605 synthase [Spiroplasma sp. TIUS-1]|uniref:pseudouridine synthase n=1 Tax=Spiroplasma sp. TIUS-1 TaxID=216963 RepID=UPI0013989B9E|nr:pseudouridine synthase [Spiroplasma sp. TIUS-1]QHX36024.1 23S rRNA pseudouridine 2605 synthase [Spiroplasma sp. TIUS-1]